MHAQGDTGILDTLADASFVKESKATWVWGFAFKKQNKRKQNKQTIFFFEQSSLQQNWK